MRILTATVSAARQRRVAEIGTAERPAENLYQEFGCEARRVALNYISLQTNMSLSAMVKPNAATTPCVIRIDLYEKDFRTFSPMPLNTRKNTMRNVADQTIRFLHRAGFRPGTNISLAA